MIFVTGGAFAGKENFIKNKLNISDEEFAEKCIRDVHLLAYDAKNLDELADRLSVYKVVITDEVGCGVVPIDRDEREKRERAGRLSCMLSERADVVIRVVCGLPMYLKGELSEGAKWL